MVIFAFPYIEIIFVRVRREVNMYVLFFKLSWDISYIFPNYTLQYLRKFILIYNFPKF